MVKDENVCTGTTIDKPPYIPGERYPYPLREVRFLHNQIWARYANYGGRGRRTCIKCIETVDAGEMGGLWWYQVNGGSHPVPRVCNTCMESVYAEWVTDNIDWTRATPNAPGYFKYKSSDIVSIVHIWRETENGLIVIHGQSINRSIRPLADYPISQDEMWSGPLPVLA